MSQYMKKYLDVSSLIHFGISNPSKEKCDLPQSQVQEQRKIFSLREKIYSNREPFKNLKPEKLMSPTLSTARKQLVQEVTEEINAVLEEIPELREHLSEHVNLERIGRGLDILGRGMMGIVFLDKKADAIIKIGRNRSSHQELSHERVMHDIFKEILEKEKEEGRVPQWIQIPDIQSRKENPVYIMDKVSGYSLNKIDFLTHPLFAEHRKYLAQELELIPIESSNTMTREEVDRIIAKEIKPISESEFDKLQKKVFDHLPRPNEISLMAENIIQRIFPDRYEAFIEALAYLEEQGVEHGDLHSGNCIIDNENILDLMKNPGMLKTEGFNIYIIDFGMTEIEREKIETNYPELLLILPNNHE
jgi:predicted Ser/Thr protein kinase